VVAGAFGGFCGLLVAYIASVVVTSLQFMIIGPILCGLSLAGAILLFRRSNTMQGELRSANMRFDLEDNLRIAKEIRDRIDSLPKNAPDSVRAALWESYGVVTSGLERIAANRLGRGELITVVPAPNVVPISQPHKTASLPPSTGDQAAASFS
jgi:hypothetical protein